MNQGYQRDIAATIGQIRAEIERLPKNRIGKRRGITEDLRQRVLAALASSGMPVNEFAAAVALAAPTIVNWSKRVPKGKRIGVTKPTRPRQPAQGGFKKVAVVAEAASGIRADAGGFSIEGPHGLRITGLGAEDLARLWRALC